MAKRGIKVKQSDTSDCGAAALSSIAAHAGLRVSIASLRHLSGTNKSGTTIKGLVDAATSIGLCASAFKGGINSLTLVPKPAILHIKKESGMLHYVVLTRALKNGFEIMDPAEGETRKILAKELEQEWSGAIILFGFPKGAKNRIRGFSPHFKELMNTVFANFRIYPSIILITTLASLSSIAIALFLRELLDKVIPMGEVESLRRLSLIMATIIFIGALLSTLRSLIVIKSGIKIEGELITNYTKKLCQIPLPFFNSFKTGELTSRLTDIYRIRGFIVEIIPETIVALVTLLLSFILLFSTNALLAAITLVFLPLYIAIYLVHDHIRKPKVQKLMESSSLFHSSFIEHLRSMESVRNFSIEQKFLLKTTNGYKKMVKELLGTLRYSIVAATGADLTSRFLILIVLLIGGNMSIRGELTTGELVSFFAMISLFTAPMQQLAISFSLYREGVVASSRLSDIMLIQSEQENRALPLAKESLVEVKNISFGYPGRGTLFSNLSFNLREGRITLLRGKSGCGKSTVVALLLKHLRPTSGLILDSFGVLPHGSWRENIAVVPQNPGLIGESIMECLVPNTDRLPQQKELEELVEELELDQMVQRFPFGFQSYPGESASFLSRGEQQRVAFARAILKGAPVLLLDEATASLDEYSRDLIIKSLLRYKREGVAILIISHEEIYRGIADEIIEM